MGRFDGKKTDDAAPAGAGVSIYVAFRVAATATSAAITHVFQVLNWKVKTDYKGTEKDGKPFCTCPRFRFESSCPHAALSVNEPVGIIGSDGKSEMAGGLEPLALTAPMSYVHVLLPGETSKVYRLYDGLPDLTLGQLVSLLTKNVLPSAARGSLSAERLYAECLESGKRSCHVEDKLVQDAGNAAAAKPASKAAAPERRSESVAPKKVAAPRPAWKSIALPDAADFYVDPDVWEQLCYCLHIGDSVLLTGPSGSGKSDVCYRAAKASGIPLEPFNMGAMSEPRSALIGNTHFSKSDGTWFKESRFVRTVKSAKAAILLDEVTRSERGAYNILLPLMDQQGYLALDESEDAGKIHRGECVTFLGTANVGMEYTGTEAIDKALMERFAVHIHMQFPPERQEAAVLTSRTGLDDIVARKLVSMAGKQRAMYEKQDFMYAISTRMLLNASKQIAAGVAFKVACKFTIENQFSPDGGDASERVKIRQLIQKIG